MKIKKKLNEEKLLHFDPLKGFRPMFDDNFKGV